MSNLSETVEQAIEELTGPHDGLSGEELREKMADAVEALTKALEGDPSSAKTSEFLAIEMLHNWVTEGKGRGCIIASDPRPEAASADIAVQLIGNGGALTGAANSIMANAIIAAVEYDIELSAVDAEDTDK